MSRLEKKKEHITGGRLCHGVNGVLPLPIMPEPFEPWPLHTERSLTLSSASSWGPRHLNDLSVSAWRLRPCSQFSVRYVRAVPTLHQPESAGLELSASVSSRFTSVQHMKEKHKNMQIRLTADGERSVRAHNIQALWSRTGRCSRCESSLKFTAESKDLRPFLLFVETVLMWIHPSKPDPEFRTLGVRERSQSVKQQGRGETGGTPAG